MPEELQPAVGEQPVQPPAISSEPPAQSAGERETATESETGEDGEQGKPKGHNLQRRIDRLIRERAQAQAEARIYREQLEAASRGRETATQTRQPAEDAEPTEDQYQTYQEYTKALARWEARQTVAQATRQQAEAQQREQWSRHQQQVEAKASQLFRAFAETTPDFEDVVLGEQGQSVKIPDAAEYAIKESDLGPQIVYHLCKNPAEAAKLNEMTPAGQVRAIGRLEEKLSSAPKPQPAVSGAPAPIQPLAGGKGEKPRFDPHKASSDDPGWDEWRRQRNKKTA